MRRNILVCGSTGKQGGSLIRALSRDASFGNLYHVLALTRSASSAAATGLLAEQRANADQITIVEGDLNDVDSIRQIFQNTAASGGIWGVFMVLAFPGLSFGSAVEEKQGKMLADLALEFQVQILLYSSALLCVSNRDDIREPSLLAKRSIETHCNGLRDNGLNVLFLRPGFFMEVLDGFTGQMAVGVFQAGLNKDIKIPLVASEDIGNLAAAIFLKHENFKDAAFAVVAEEATMDEITSAHQRALGTPMPTITYLLALLFTFIHPGVRNIIEELTRSHRFRLSEGESAFASQVHLARSTCKLQTYFEWRMNQKERGADQSKSGIMAFIKLLTGQS